MRESSIQALEKSVELEGVASAYDSFFLAMAHWQLGHTDEAREWYHKGLQWMQEHAPDKEELMRFQSEAQELLEVTDSVSRDDSAANGD